MDFFLKKNEKWLEVNMSFPTCSNIDKSGKHDRPLQKFSSLHERSKRRRTKELRRNFTSEELSHATQMSLSSSGQIIASVLLPIGQLSEEAQESRNKDVKKYREGFSRKCSRRKTMEDVLNQLLVSSDPYISSLRKLPKQKIKELLPEAKQLLSIYNIDDISLQDSDQILCIIHK